MSPTNPPPRTVSQTFLLSTGISVGVILLLILIIVVGTTVIVILRIRKHRYKGILLLINF